MKFNLKKFLSYYRPYLGLFLSVIFCACIMSATTLVFPLLTRYITKTVLAGGFQNALGEIYKVGAVMLALIALKTACNYYYDYYGHAMGAMMEGICETSYLRIIRNCHLVFMMSKNRGVNVQITNDLLSLSELYHHGRRIMLYI